MRYGERLNDGAGEVVDLDAAVLENADDERRVMVVARPPDCGIVGIGVARRVLVLVERWSHRVGNEHVDLVGCESSTRGVDAGIDARNEQSDGREAQAGRNQTHENLRWRSSQIAHSRS